MTISRRDFGTSLVGTAIGAGGLPATALAQAAPSPLPEPKRPPFFFQHPTFEMIFLTSLGRAYHGGGDVGKVLAIAAQTQDGDFESAYVAFQQAGDEARAIAKDSLDRNHRESARQAFLWAQNYHDSGTYFLDGTQDPSRFAATWELLYDSWLQSLPLFDPPIEPVPIPYEGTHLHGFFIPARGKAPASGKRPLLILVNGSDGSLLDMWLWGAAGAVARGYHCLTFDGPGQGHALWKQKLHFRPDWEKVVTPVVDYALSRPDVDPKRIAIQGISQGGYWVPRAVAFEPRIAAAIADPGVVDVATSWLRNLPEPMRKLLRAGRQAEFDEAMAKSLTPATKGVLAFRMRPYGFSSYYDAFQAATEYRLTPDILGRIRCPVLVTDPENEAYWPGQSRELYDGLTSPRTLVHFTAKSGADLHCEPKGTGLRDLRVFDWLDEVLGRS